jgi:hypothetical protein
MRAKGTQVRRGAQNGGGFKVATILEFPARCSTG